MAFTAPQTRGTAAPAAGRLAPLRGARASRVIVSASRSIMTPQRAALHLSRMRPLGQRLLVEPQESAEASAGGVLLPGSAGARSPMAPAVGTVLAVGTGVDPELGIVAGDRVLFSKYGTADVDVAEGEGVFVDQGAVLAKLSA